MSRLHTLRPLVVTLSVSLVLAAPVAHGDEAPQPHDGHLHVSLVNSPGAALKAADIDRLAAEVGSEGFLTRKASESSNPLSPCALLAATVISSSVNVLFYEVIQGRLTLPPKGTYIFGKYDWKSLLWLGALPSDPETGADALARLTVLQSWKATTIAATQLSDLNQAQCLTLLTDMDTMPQILSPLNEKPPVLAHPEFMSLYVTTIDKTTGDTLLAQLPTPEFLPSPASDRANPLAPCSLLRGFRLGARLNDDWFKLGTGKLPIPNNALLLNYPPTGTQPNDGLTALPTESPLKPMATQLADPAFLRGGSAKSAEVVARALGHEIVRTNQLTEMLLEASQATQADCLAEIREPSTLRKRLIEKKISLPLR